MNESENTMLEGQVLDEFNEISVVQLCRSCAVEAELVDRLVAEGILEPSRREGGTLYFAPSCIRRTRLVVRLRSDLGINLAGAALALELLERIDALESRLRLAALGPMP